jgi:hypothetical protein
VLLDEFEWLGMHCDPTKQLVVLCEVCGRPSTKVCYVCEMRFCDFCTRKQHWKGKFGLHWPVVNAPVMREQLAKKELEKKRIGLSHHSYHKCYTTVTVVTPTVPQVLPNCHSCHTTRTISVTQLAQLSHCPCRTGVTQLSQLSHRPCHTCYTIVTVVGPTRATSRAFKNVIVVQAVRYGQS